MDPRDLKAASKYVNNLLASRGLLRGKEIPFHKPGEDDGTPAKIINLIHELLSRRDKEAEEREALALTIRTLRTTEMKQADTIEALKTKTTDLTRQNGILDSASRSFNHTLRTSEVAQRTLRDETVRLKTLLSQVRTQCANDIRKRDIQIQKMKERLSDTRPRGQRAQLASCTVINPSSNLSASRSSAAGGEEETNIAQETTDFLTKLSQDLADENDNLIALIRTTLSTLKAIQGLPDDDHFLPPGNDEETQQDHENPVIAPPASFEDLTADLDQVIFSLKEVLNQPNYVPVEDLAEKEAEIERLVTKNEMLEVEWKKAIDLVDEWNKTMSRNFTQVTEGGDTVEEARVEGNLKKAERTIVGIVKERGMDEEEVEVEEGEMEEGVRGILSMVQEEDEEEEEGAREEIEAETQGIEGAAKEMQEMDEGLEQEAEQVEEIEQDSQQIDQDPEEIVEELEEVVPQSSKKSPSRKQPKRKSQPSQPTPEPPQSSAKKDNRRKSGKDTPFRQLFQGKEIATKSPSMVPKPSTRRRGSSIHDSMHPEEPGEVIEVPVKGDRRKKAKKDSITFQEVEEASVIFKSPVKKSGRKKTTKINFEEDASIRQLVLEEAQATPAPVLQLKKGRRKAGKNLATEPETTIQTEADETVLTEEAEAPKRKERKRRLRKGEEEEVTVGEMIEVSALEEIMAEEEAPKPKERKRRASRAKKDTEVSDLDLFLTKAIQDDAEEETATEVQPESKRKGRRRREEADGTTAETTTTETTTLEDTFEEVSKKPGHKRRPSRGKKPENDSMLDDLSAEPVPIHYEEISNKVQIVTMRDQDEGEEKEGGVKLSRARRRSLRNRDKHPANLVKAQETVPVAASPSIPKRKRKSTSAGQSPRKRVARGVDSSLVGDD